MENETAENESNSDSTRRRFLGYVAAGAAGAALIASGAGLSPLRVAAATSEVQSVGTKLSPAGKSNGVNVVLVHGIWADATS